ncbi:MAG: helix-turn-helix transcriptional regulator [Clostridiales bacterium]|nr:helix-turn-helix transcriptional regulator [Clostridiales bacterium]
MFINKASDGKNNLCGKSIFFLRKERGWSQNELAKQIQLQGLNLGKNAVQRIESGQRFITDIELAIFASVFDCAVDDLYNTSK